MIHVDAIQLKNYSNMMQKQFPKQFAFAVKQTLDNIAYNSAMNFKKSVSKDKFTIRNDYIQKSVQFDKAAGLNIDTMHSQFGQVKQFRGRDTAGQLDLQNQGGIKKSRSKKLWKATKTGRTSQSYSKPIVKKYRVISRTKTGNIIKNAKNSKQRRAALIHWAKRIGFDGLLLFKSPSTNKTGAYKIIGKKIKKIFDVSKTNQKIKATHWMAASYKQSVENRDKYMSKNLSKQVDYLKRYNKL